MNSVATLLVGLITGGLVIGLMLALLIRFLRHAQRSMLAAQESLRDDQREAARADRTELRDALTQMQQAITTQLSSHAALQNEQLREVGARTERLTTSNEQRLVEMRNTIESRLTELRNDNAKKLDEMRQTVDEKLHKTLESRLGESFKLVSERLEAVHKGLGEMQTLAVGVGDLKKVLTNVKTRGTWGEVQLESLLEQVLTADQYEKNVVTKPGSNERVEFAIRLPGHEPGETPVWLPIDAKFPREDYERLLDAQERGDAIAAEAAARDLDTCLRKEARTLREKYLAPPHTTDFALLFLPTEGLYAEALRRPGLTDWMQRETRITLAGPTTLTALLNSLQMGFRTLAIQQRSSEVWQLLSTVRGEFGKFGELIARTKKQLETASKSLGAVETKSRTIARRLHKAETLGDEALGREPTSELTSVAADETSEEDPGVET